MLYTLLRWSEKYTKTDMVYFMQGNFWLIGGRVLATGSGFLLTIAFANLLNPTAFGTYKYVLAIAAVIGAFSLGGMGAAVMRAMAMGERNVVPGVARVNMLWSLPAAIVAAAIAGWYAWNGNIVLSGGILMIALTTPLMNNYGLAKSIYIGMKDFQTLALITIPRNLIAIGVLIGTLFLTQNVLIILTIYFLSNLIASWSGYRYAIKKYGIKDEKENVAETVTFGKHWSVMGTVSQLVGNLDQLMLWHFVGPVALAMYAFASAPVRELKSLTDNVNTLLFPKYALKTVEEMKETAPLRIKQLLLVSVTMALIYIAAAQILFQTLFPQYMDAVFASQILALGLALQPKNIIEMMLFAQGNVRLRYITTFFAQGARVLLWLILIPLYGFMGAVIGFLIADVLAALSMWWAYKRLE